MTKRDTGTRLSALADDVVTGFGLLTRLPVPTRGFTGARSVWVWPVVGAVLGGMVALCAAIAVQTGLPNGVVAALVMGLSALLTGAMHEDGLADTFDGLFGGWTPERRLEIMKDSRIGSYGVLALVTVALMRWSALVVLIEAQHWSALVAAGALSRAPMAVLMAALPNARQGGLSAATGRPAARDVLVCCALALGMAAASGCSGFVAMTIAVTLAAGAVGLLARARIGGQTGDILGAAQHLAEVMALSAAAAHLA